MRKRAWHDWWLLTTDTRAETVHCETNQGKVSEYDFELEYPGELAKFKAQHIQNHATLSAKAGSPQGSLPGSQ